MTKTSQLILVLLGILSFGIQAQIPEAPNQTDHKGHKQDKWTILYDKDWNVITDTNKVEFYRTLTYQDNKPIGKVTDWYKNGKPQMVADSVISEKPEKYEGNLSYYSAAGNITDFKYYKQGGLDKKQTLKLFQEIVDKQSKEIPKHLDYALSCNNLALLYDKQGLYDKATSLYREVKDILAAILGKKHSSYASSCNNLADLYEKQGLYEKALPLYIESKNIREVVLGKKHPHYATSCNNLASLYYRQGLYDEAVALYIEAKDIQEVVLGKKHPHYATSCNNLAALYEKQGLYEKALPLYIESKDIREVVLGKKHPLYTSSCNNLANLYQKQGLYKKATTLYIESKDIREVVLGKKHPSYAISCSNLAVLYDKQGLYKKAEVLYIEAKDIEEKVLGKKHPSYAISCSSLGALYEKQGLYAQALPLYIEAKDIEATVLGKKHPDYAISCNNLAGLYEKQGLYAQALPLYIEAKDIEEEVLGKKHPSYATSCNNLASLYQKQGLYAQALPLYREAKNIRDEVLGKKHPDYATSCNSLANLHEKQGLYDKALPLYIEAKDIEEEVLGKKHPSYATSCNNLASLYQKQGLYAQALPLYREAKNIRDEVLGKKHPLYASSCNNLASLYGVQGLYAQAAPLYTEATQNKLAQIETLLATFSENERQQYIQSIEYFFEVFYRFSALYYPEKATIANDLFNTRIKLKGLLFQSFQKMQQQILNSGDSTLIARYQDWKAQRTYLAKVYELSKSEKQKQGIDEAKLKAKAEQLEKELSKTVSNFSNLTNLDTYTWQDVQQQLQKNEALVEIIRVQVAQDTVKYLALVLTPETQNQPNMVILDNGKDLEQKYIKYYRNVIKYQKADKHSYTQFWEVIAQKIPANTQKIYFSPDGVYHQLNLETLRNPQTNTYLSDNYEFQILGTPKDLIRYANNPQKQQKKLKEYQLYLFGYPLYSPLAPKGGNEPEKEEDRTLTTLFTSPLEKEGLRFFTGGKVSLLPGTKTEIEQIQQLAQKQNIKTTLFLENEASEENLKQVQNPDILHIATHGFFLSNISINKANERGFMGAETQQFRENPLLRSGLLLAGAEATLNDQRNAERTENGILTAEEAMTLDLEGTDLVVLSACETGLGEISNGEGVYGLQRTFQQAGAKTLLMSLWTVSDEATQKMMTYFYENLLKKKQDKRTAFRNAQKKLRKEFPEPYYWGAFVMIGE